MFPRRKSEGGIDLNVHCSLGRIEEKFFPRLDTDICRLGKLCATNGASLIQFSHGRLFNTKEWHTCITYNCFHLG